MRTTEHSHRVVVGWLICLVALLFTVWSFYPGLMTEDSIASLTQGRTNHYRELNAPLMSWIWGRLDLILAGPGLIFTLHLVIFWAATVLFWQSTHKRSIWLGIGIVFVGLLPHILGVAVVVWKDVAMAVGLFMAVALLYFARVRNCISALLISPFFLFYGSAARLNAFVAVLPIALWTGLEIARLFEVKRNILIGSLLGLCYLLLLSTSAFTVNFILTAGRSDQSSQQIYLYDLAAISVERSEPLFPTYILDDPDFSMMVVKERYNERSVNELIWPNLPNPGDRSPLKWTEDPTKVEQLREVWEGAILLYPGAYFRHRLAVFRNLVGLKWSVPAPFLSNGFGSNPPEFRGDSNLGYIIAMRYLSAFGRPISQMVFHRAAIWMIICSALIVCAIRRKLRGDWQLVVVLSASCLLYIAAYFPTAPSAEYRYLFWPAIASTIAAIFGVFLLKSEKILNFEGRQ